MKITNVGKSPIGIANKIMLDIGQEIEVAEKDLRAMMSPALQGHFDEGRLIKSASKPGPKPAAETGDSDD